MSYITEHYDLEFDIQPFGNYVFVELMLPNKEELSKAGLVVVKDTTQEAPQIGLVVAVGPGLVDLSGNRIPMQTEPGDYVVVQKHAPFQVRDWLGRALKIPETWFALSEGDILCRLNNVDNLITKYRESREDYEKTQVGAKKQEKEQRTKIAGATPKRKRSKRIIYRDGKKVEEDL